MRFGFLCAMNIAWGNHAIDPLNPKPLVSSHKGIILVVLKDSALIVPCKDSSERVRWGSAKIILEP